MIHSVAHYRNNTESPSASTVLTLRLPQSRRHRKAWCNLHKFATWATEFGNHCDEGEGVFASLVAGKRCIQCLGGAEKRWIREAVWDRLYI